MTQYINNVGILLLLKKIIVRYLAMIMAWNNVIFEYKFLFYGVILFLYLKYNIN